MARKKRKKGKRSKISALFAMKAIARKKGNWKQYQALDAKVKALGY